MCQNSDKRAGSDLQENLTLLCAHTNAWALTLMSRYVLCLSCSLLRGFSAVAGAPWLAGLGLCTEGAGGAALGKLCRTSAPPSTTDLALFPGNAKRLCWEGLLGPCQLQPYLSGVQHEMLNAPLPCVLACTHCEWWYLGKKDQLFWGC